MSNFVGQFKDKDGNILFPEIAEIGTFGEGEYIKFENGWAIVLHKQSYTAQTSIGFAGGLYRSPSFPIGDFPFPFTKLPLIEVTSHNTNDGLLWGSCYNERTLTSFPRYIVYAAENSNKNFVLSCLAIGMWK